MIQVISQQPMGLHEGQFQVQTNLRIPGLWPNPRVLIDRINRRRNRGVSIRGKTLTTPDGCFQIEFAQRHREFPKVFRTACEDKMTSGDRRELDRYQSKVMLSSRTGSMDSLRKLMRAARLFVDRGGIGVFVDNGTKAHRSRTWLQMMDHDDVDAVTYAFVAVRKHEGQWRTVGMNSLGRPDISIACGDVSEEKVQYDTLVETVYYLAESPRSFDEGHIIGDGMFANYQAVKAKPDLWSVEAAESPLYNPAGLLRLESIERFEHDPESTQIQELDIVPEQEKPILPASM